MTDESSQKDPVTEWINDLRRSEPAAATKLWNHFFDQLRQHALRKLQPGSRRVYDEEDAALSAFQSFCGGVAAGRYPDLQDRDDLLCLLLCITGRKVSHRHRFDGQQRRDIRKTLTESALAGFQNEVSHDKIGRAHV